MRVPKHMESRGQSRCLPLLPPLYFVKQGLSLNLELSGIDLSLSLSTEVTGPCCHTRFPYSVGGPNSGPCELSHWLSPLPSHFYDVSGGGILSAKGVVLISHSIFTATRIRAPLFLWCFWLKACVLQQRPGITCGQRLLLGTFQLRICLYI